jgi:translation initiation factor 3 subunit B
MWRPRPPTLLSAEKQEEIKSNLDKYAKEYKKDEDDVINIHIREDRERKAQLSKEFAQRMANWKRMHDNETAERRALRGM